MQRSPDPLIRDGSEKRSAPSDVSGLQIWEMGQAVLGGLQGVLKLCSQTTEGGIDQSQGIKVHDTFPLPTSRNQLSPFVFVHGFEFNVGLSFQLWSGREWGSSPTTSHQDAGSDPCGSGGGRRSDEGGEGDDTRV